jgi:hypothetical protein
MELGDKKASRIKIEKEGDIYDKESWEEQFEWLIEEGKKLQTLFTPYIDEYSS